MKPELPNIYIYEYIYAIRKRQVNDQLSYRGGLEGASDICNRLEIDLVVHKMKDCAWVREVGSNGNESFAGIRR